MKFFVALLPFALFLLVLPRLRTVEPTEIVDTFILGAAFCGLLALPLAAFQAFWLGLRPEGGAGNAIPFGMVCALFASVSLLNVASVPVWRRTLGWAGFVAGILCVFLSESRGVLPVPLLGLAIFFIMYPEERARFRNRRMAAAALAAAVLIMAVAYDRMGRMWLLVSSVFKLEPGAADNSLNLRVQMWDYALGLIAERPWLGHGLQNRRSLVAELDLGFSHFHNGFLTALVDSGVIGLVSVVLLILAPLLCVLYNRSRVQRRERLFLALILAITYTVGGMTNFVFLHDIYDSVFLWTALIVAVPLASASGGHPDAPEDGHVT